MTKTRLETLLRTKATEQWCALEKYPTTNDVVPPNCIAPAVPPRHVGRQTPHDTDGANPEKHVVLVRAPWGNQTKGVPRARRGHKPKGPDKKRVFPLQSRPRLTLSNHSDRQCQHPLYTMSNLSVCTYITKRLCWPMPRPAARVQG